MPGLDAGTSLVACSGRAIWVALTTADLRPHPLANPPPHYRPPTPHYCRPAASTPSPCPSWPALPAICTLLPPHPTTALHLIIPPTGGVNPQFMPSLAGICTLFSRWRTAASLWVHLLAINLFAAREMYLEGARPPC